MCPWYTRCMGPDGRGVVGVGVAQEGAFVVVALNPSHPTKATPPPNASKNESRALRGVAYVSSESSHLTFLSLHYLMPLMPMTTLYMQPLIMNDTLGDPLQFTTALAAGVATKNQTQERQR